MCTVTLGILFQREWLPWVKYGPDIHARVKRAPVRGCEGKHGRFQNHMLLRRSAGCRKYAPVLLMFSVSELEGREQREGGSGQRQQAAGSREREAARALASRLHCLPSPPQALTAPFCRSDALTLNVLVTLHVVQIFFFKDFPEYISSDSETCFRQEFTSSTFSRNDIVPERSPVFCYFCFPSSNTQCWKSCMMSRRAL